MKYKSVEVAEIFNALKVMKLPGMAEAFQEQSRDPSYAKLSFQERFGLIVRHELSSRTSRRIERLIKESRMRYPLLRLEELKYGQDDGIEQGLLRELCACDWLTLPTCPSVVITGPTGTGKTTIAHALGLAACDRSIPVLCYRLPELLEALDFQAMKHECAQFVGKINKKPLLIIDDFAMNPISQEQSKNLLTLLAGREGVASTVIASQLPVEMWHQQLGSLWDADAIVDRLIGTSYRIELKGESKRMNPNLTLRATS